MRIILLTLIGLSLITSTMFLPAVVAEVNPEPQKFKVTFKVTYNEMTLEEAAEMERFIKKAHKDACEVHVEAADITMETENGYTLTFEE